MADDIDRASELNDLALAADIKKATAVSGPAATGCCLYCEEQMVSNEVLLLMIREDSPAPTGTPRFCDSECRDGWQEEQNIKRKQGLIK